MEIEQKAVYVLVFKFDWQKLEIETSILDIA